MDSINKRNISLFTALLMTFTMLIGHLNAAEKSVRDSNTSTEKDEVLVGVSHFAGWWKETAAYPETELGSGRAFSVSQTTGNGA